MNYQSWSFMLSKLRLLNSLQLNQCNYIQSALKCPVIQSFLKKFRIVWKVLSFQKHCNLKWLLYLELMHSFKKKLLQTPCKKNGREHFIRPTKHNLSKFYIVVCHSSSKFQSAVCHNIKVQCVKVSHYSVYKCTGTKSHSVSKRLITVCDNVYVQCVTVFLSVTV